MNNKEIKEEKENKENNENDSEWEQKVEEDNKTFGKKIDLICCKQINVI